MKFALAGGGTGGHAYPALTVGRQLREQRDTELVYYGTREGPERDLAEEQEIVYRVIPATQLRGRSPMRIMSGVWNLWRGSRTARRFLNNDRPDAVFATGGYASAPIGRAARQLRIPLVVFLPDVKPGWAVRLLQRYASTIVCSVDGSLPYLPASKTIVTGYPVRNQFLNATRKEGIQRFGLDASLQTLLIAGGSLGSHQINMVIRDEFSRLLTRLQIIHISGRDEFDWLSRERAQLPEWQQKRYSLHPYTNDMALAMAAADLAVTRAGASTLGELPVMGLPAILIPGEFSDQSANAQYLENCGATSTITRASIDSLADEVLALLDDDHRLRSMSFAMRQLDPHDAAARIASLLRRTAS